MPKKTSIAADGLMVLKEFVEKHLALTRLHKVNLNLFISLCYSTILSPPKYAS
jgi:hypothetical protein